MRSSLTLFNQTNAWTVFCDRPSLSLSLYVNSQFTVANHRGQFRASAHELFSQNSFLRKKDVRGLFMWPFQISFLDFWKKIVSDNDIKKMLFLVQRKRNLSWKSRERPERTLLALAWHPSWKEERKTSKINGKWSTQVQVTMNLARIVPPLRADRKRRWARISPHTNNARGYVCSLSSVSTLSNKDFLLPRWAKIEPISANSDANMRTTNRTRRVNINW